MKTERHYKQTDPEAKRKQAVEDCHDYCTDEMWSNLLAYVKSCTTVEEVHFGCGMIGIEGYPCTALWETYRVHIDETTKETP